MIIASVLIIGFALMCWLALLAWDIETKKPSERHIKKEITAYLDKNLDDKYEIKNIIKQDDKETIYSLCHVDWESDDVITVDEDEVTYVKTILRERGIGFWE